MACDREDVSFEVVARVVLTPWPNSITAAISAGVLAGFSSSPWIWIF
jgi:hypothetical protein